MGVVLINEKYVSSIPTLETSTGKTHRIFYLLRLMNQSAILWRTTCASQNFVVLSSYFACDKFVIVSLSKNLLWTVAIYQHWCSLLEFSCQTLCFYGLAQVQVRIKSRIIHFSFSPGFLELVLTYGYSLCLLCRLGSLKPIQQTIIDPIQPLYLTLEYAYA